MPTPAKVHPSRPEDLSLVADDLADRIADLRAVCAAMPVAMAPVLSALAEAHERLVTAGNALALRAAQSWSGAR